MTAKKLCDILVKCGIPDDAKIMIEKEWVSCAIDVEQVFYNPESNTVILTQNSHNQIFDAPPWFYCAEDIAEAGGPVSNIIEEYRGDSISRKYAISQLELLLEESNDQEEQEYVSRFIDFLQCLPAKKFTDKS